MTNFQVLKTGQLVSEVFKRLHRPHELLRFLCQMLKMWQDCDTMFSSFHCRSGYMFEFPLDMINFPQSWVWQT